MLTVISIIGISSLMLFAIGFFVAVEFAMVKLRARKILIMQMADAGSLPAKITLPLIKDKKAIYHMLAATQIGITVVSLALGAYGQRVIATGLAQFLTGMKETVTQLTNGRIPAASLSDILIFSISTTGVLLVLTTLQVLVGELIPKSIALRRPEQTALLTALPIKYFVALMRPFIWFFNGSSNLVLKFLGVNYSEIDSHAHSPHEIEILVTDSHEGGLIDDRAQQMLRNAFRLRELTARQMMVPRTRLEMASSDSDILSIINLSLDTGFTRIPIYEETIDRIMGFVHIKDLFIHHQKGEESLKKVLREVAYIPETMPVIEVWKRLKRHGQYIVVVIDEYGGTAGLITFEDLIEEIFGEVRDEFDEEAALFFQDKQGRTHLRGDLLVADINEYLDLDLPLDQADTIGGLIFNTLAYLPEVGEEIKINQLIIRVEIIEDLRISEVSLQLSSDDVPTISEWS